MILALLEITLGILFLTWSADKLVAGSSSLAKHLKIAPLIIGLTIVALGTCMPEVVVSIIASLNHNSEIAIGNAVGSNITNIGLVLGLCALIHPLSIETVTIRKEIPILAVVTIIATLLLWFVGLNVLSSSLMLLGAIAFIYWLVDRGRKQRRNDEFIEGLAPNLSIKMSIFWIIVGLLVLVSSAKALIEGAVYLAHYFEIPELVIGLTLVAVGTSLPELAASLIATLKKEYGIAVGNVIGSNIFNLTLVLSAPGFVTPNQPITNRVFLTDLPVMVLMTMILVFLGFKKDNQDKIGRYSGALFLVIYVVYIGFMAVEQMV